MGKIKFFTRYIRDTAGSILPLVALTMPLIVGIAGVGVDVSMWMYNKRNLQTAADAAVIAAAWEIANDYEDEAEEVALREAIRNGFSDDAENDLDIEISENEDGETIVTAIIREKAHKYFSQVVFSGEVFTGAAAATAIIVAAGDGDFCLLSLDPEADGAITAVGTVDVDSIGCGIAVNSSSDSALDLTGNVSVAVKDIHIVGDYEAGNNVDMEYETMKTGGSTVADPYADLEIPFYGGCSRSEVRDGPLRISSDMTLEPGVYCGGIVISGNVDIEFEPGVYFIDGGDFSVSGGGSLTGENVSFILTNSGNGSWGNLDISGGKELFFTAPAEGAEMEGVVFYQDREAPESNQCNSLTGTSAIELQGAAYFPSRCLDIGGNHGASSSQSSPCTRIIAQTIKLHGTPSLGNNCEGVPVKNIGAGTSQVKLVL